MKKDLKQNLPYHLLRLSTKCNARCLFCNVPAESPEFACDHSTEEMKARISELAGSGRGFKLSLSGGEPTLRTDLAELIRYAARKGAGEIEIQTNAILLADMGRVAKLKEAGLAKAFVGFHSHLPATHDRLAGVAGAHKKCVRGIKNLTALGIEVILNPVVTTLNFKQLPAFIKYIHREFPAVKYISLSVVQPRGRAWVDKKIVPRYGLIGPYIKEALALGEKFDIVINNPFCGLPFCQGGWDKHLDRCVEYCENRFRKREEQGRHQAKIKPRQCARCKFNLRCNGVWREYAAIHPLSDLRPILNEKTR